MSATERNRPAAAGRPMWIAAGVLLAVLMGVAGLKSTRDLATARGREAELAARVEAARQRIEALEQRIDGLHNDPRALERAAREELGLVYPGDVVYLLPAQPTPDLQHAGGAPEKE